jgi:hypothetical protein
MRVHTYVIATDAGSAPNYDPPFVTLAVCKPRIRRKADIGELVLAFAVRPPVCIGLAFPGTPAHRNTTTSHRRLCPLKCTETGHFLDALCQEV